MQRGRGAARPPIGIAFDGDLGHRIDAVLGLAMLNGVTSRSEARRISLSVSRPSLKAAQLADAISSFYAGRPAGGSTGGIGAVREGMVGMPEGAPDAAPPLAGVLAKTAPDGAPMYGTTIDSVIDTAESAILIRNLILAQHDGNAAIVLAGPATGLVRILDLYRAVAQVTAKVKYLVVALGAYPSGAADPSVKADVAAARKLFAEWPTPLVAVGTEVGEALAYPASSIETDFAWAPAHPVVDAYRAFKPMPYDAPSAALAAVLHAVHADQGYFATSEPGTITVLDDGRTQFTAGPEGRHQYLKVDPAQKERVLKLYTELVAAPPAPSSRARPARCASQSAATATTAAAATTATARACPRGAGSQTTRSAAAGRTAVGSLIGRGSES